MNDRVSRVTPDGRTARWAEHRAARRDELIEFAVLAIGRHGSDVNMDQIAAVAGTSKPVIYRYFEDKSELYRAVGRHVVASIVARLQAVHEPRDGHVDLDPKATLRLAIDGYLSLLDDNPQLFRFVAQHRLLPEVRAGRSQPAEHGDPISDPISDPVSAILTRALGDQLAAVGFDREGAQPWGEAAVAFIRTASLWWLDHPGAMTRDRLTDYLVGLLWGGAAGVLQSAGLGVDARPDPNVFRIA